MTDLSAYLTELRKSRGLTMTAFARAANVTTSLISQLGTEKKLTLGPAVCVQLSRGLGLSEAETAKLHLLAARAKGYRV